MDTAEAGSRGAVDEIRFGALAGQRGPGRGAHLFSV
jgi:hypothetical protein